MAQHGVHLKTQGSSPRLFDCIQPSLIPNPPLYVLQMRRRSGGGKLRALVRLNETELLVFSVCVCSPVN
jgi:hypothetical protein